MRKKLIPILILASSFLFADSIVGAWTIDKNKVKALVEDSSKSEMEQFFLGMIVIAFSPIEFKEDGSCQVNRENRTKCWEKGSATSYILYDENANNSGSKVKVRDKDNIELILNKDNTKLKIPYNRIDASSLVVAKVMKKDRLYHAKDIEMKDFHTKGSGYFLFTGENEFYHLSTEKLTSLSLKELQEIKAKDEREEGGFLLKKGAYQVNSGGYSIKNNTFYTSFDPFCKEFNQKKIEIVDETHIKFNGYDYYLE